MMKKSILRDRCAVGTLALALGFTPAVVQAQDETIAEDVIVVTGSYIRGTPEDAAVPVDVYTSADPSQNGISSPLEFIKNLPEVGSVLGDSNQFSSVAQNNQGFGSINLRNLGPTRTLVLFNGRRTLTAPGAVGGGFGDTNAIPLFALDRVEILKDGAAATYGSDAIAGVANFITKAGFEGVELQSDYNFVDGSDDNYSASILVGQNFGDLNIMAGFGWQHRPKPPTSDELVAATRPYFDFVIAKFGVDRCMWESNFPVDKLSSSYNILWNSFKKISKDFSADEKAKLFHDTATRIYSL